jgi:uncharacterized protein involved in outer membrane biogenesis
VNTGVKKALKIGAAGFALLLLMVGLFVAWKLRSVGSPQFKDTLLAEARERLGVEVQAKALEVSVFEGLRLEGVRVKNPSGYAGDLLTADAFLLRYRLSALLMGRIELTQLALRKPVVRILSDTRGEYNYERMTSRSGPDPSRAPGPAPRAGVSAFVRGIVISRLAMEDGSLTLAEGRSAFLRAENANFESSIALAEATSEGKGRASLGTLAFAEALFLRDISAPLSLTTESLRLGPVKARLAAGRVNGDIRLAFKPSLRYTMKLDVDGASVKTLLAEARAAPTMTGTLAAKASFSGTAGLPTLKGTASAEVRDCALTGAPVMRVLALALQLPELADPRFEHCRAEFDILGVQARTPVLVLKGRALELTGKGVYNLQTAALDYDMNLLLPAGVYRRVTAKAVRGAFKERDDGSASLDFRVSGTSTAPRTDIAARIAGAAAMEAAKGGLSRLFRKRRE